VIAALKPLFPNHEICDTPRAEHQPDIGQNSFIEQSTGMFSTAELLYDALTTEGQLGRDNLFVNLSHLVTRLEVSGGKITKVICQDLVGNQQRIYQAHKFVLAAGSIESPRIALRSGLTNPNNKTGVGLTDHGSWFSAQFVIPAGSAYVGKDKYARIFFYADPNAQHRFNTEIELNGEYGRVRHSNTAYWQDYLADKNETYLKLKCTCATPLIDTNFVQLNTNPDDKVRVRMPRCTFGAETRPAVELLVGGILNFFGVTGYDLTKDDQLGFGNEGTPHHAGGTMRVSGDHSGVVDTNLKHEGYSNLYVCDQSVAPFIAAANPSLTLVALALRLANHL
jgi:choline dehydrogenase-like flavoprotein